MTWTLVEPPFLLIFKLFREKTKRGKSHIDIQRQRKEDKEKETKTKDREERKKTKSKRDTKIIRDTQIRKACLRIECYLF